MNGFKMQSMSSFAVPLTLTPVPPRAGCEGTGLLRKTGIFH